MPATTFVIFRDSDDTLFAGTVRSPKWVDGMNPKLAKTSTKISGEANVVRTLHSLAATGIDVFDMVALHNNGESIIMTDAVDFLSAHDPNFVRPRRQRKAAAPAPKVSKPKDPELQKEAMVNRTGRRKPAAAKPAVTKSPAAPATTAKVNRKPAPKAPARKPLPKPKAAVAKPGARRAAKPLGRGSK